MHILPSLLTPALIQVQGAAPGPDLTRYFMVCALIVLLIIGLAFGFRHLFAASLRRRAAGRSLQLIDVLPLGGKQRLGVVRCYDRTFLLGLGEREVSLVSELDAVIGNEKAGTLPEQKDQDFMQLLETAQERIQASGAKATPRKGARMTELVG